jgi:hypothetical protein
MNLESPKVTVQKISAIIWLINRCEKEKLMPDSIAKFEIIGEDAFIFGLKGMKSN